MIESLDYLSNGNELMPGSQPSPVDARSIRPHYPRSWFVTHDPMQLEQIFKEGISVGVLRRAPDPVLQTYWAGHAVRSVERIVRIDTEVPLFATVLHELGDPPDELTQELLRLLRLYAALADCRWVGLRLCVTDTVPCRRFHVDRVGLRLICTWQGRGTQWLEHQDVNRRWLGHGTPRDVPDECSGLIRRGAQIHELRTFDIGVFKGEAWPGNEARGAVHRSPAVNNGQRRVMLTLDALEDDAGE